MQFSVGEIVLAQIPDPENQVCEDPHPVVVFRTSQHDPSFWVVGITGSFVEPLPWYWLRMPFAENGHPVTGLYKECVLKANWVDICSPSQVVCRMGTVLDAAHFAQITDLVWAVVKKKSKGEAL